MLNIEFIKDSLIGKTFVSSVHYFDEIDSTNNFAKNLNSEDNALVLTEYQSEGKGRFERAWDSEKGMNLMFSVKKKFYIDAKQNSYINFYFSYFLYDTIRSVLEENSVKSDTNMLNIKWPNDILLDSKKISGLLIESILNKKDYIIGAGLNVNQKEFHSGLNASSLINHTKAEINLSQLLVKIINSYDRNMDLIYDSKFDEIYNLWKKSTNMIGKDVEFTINNAINCGKIIGLMEDGGIKILADNEEKTYHSGEIKIRRKS